MKFWEFWWKFSEKSEKEIDDKIFQNVMNEVVNLNSCETLHKFIEKLSYSSDKKENIFTSLSSFSHFEKCSLTAAKTKITSLFSSQTFLILFRQLRDCYCQCENIYKVMQIRVSVNLHEYTITSSRGFVLLVCSSVFLVLISHPTWRVELSFLFFPTPVEAKFSRFSHFAIRRKTDEKVVLSPTSNKASFSNSWITFSE